MKIYKTGDHTYYQDEVRTFSDNYLKVGFNEVDGGIKITINRTQSHDYANLISRVFDPSEILNYYGNPYGTTIEEIVNGYSDPKPKGGIYRYMDTNGDGTGTKSAVGNYVTPTRFFIQPPDGEVYHLKRAMISVRDSDRKSTRLNSSHRCISYAVFCLKKKT